MSLIAANQTVSRGVYGMAIRNGTTATDEFLVAQTERIATPIRSPPACHQVAARNGRAHSEGMTCRK